MAAKSVLMFVPAVRAQISAQTFLTSHAVMQALFANGMAGGVASLGGPDIVDVRNLALTMWFDAMSSSHLLFVDDDMGFAPQLVLDMLSLNEGVVGAIYRKRVADPQWVGSGMGPAAALRNGFMAVEGIGMGCALISRDAIELMLSKLPAISDDRIKCHVGANVFAQAGVKRVIRAFDRIEDAERGPVSEDISFCRRFNSCGGIVWAATHHSINHVGPYDYQGCYAEHVAKAPAS